MVAESGDVANPEPDSEREALDEEEIFVEPRWPIAVVLSSFIVLTIVLRIAEPERESLGPHWLAPAIEVGLLLALIAANPAHLVGRARWLRPLSISLIGLLAAVGLFSTVVLISDLVRGSKVTESAPSLLASGALIWLGNALIFGLLYWIWTAAARWPATATSARTPTSRSHNRARSSLHPIGGPATSTTSSSASRPAWRSARPT